MKAADKISTFFPAIAGFIIVILIGFAYPVHCQAEELPVIEKSINIAPNIINLVSVEHHFGIHTNIRYIDIDTSTVKILCADGETVMDDEVFCYADYYGNLIANSSNYDLRDACDPEGDPDHSSGDYYTLYLTGESFLTFPGDPEKEPYAFTGNNDVMVLYGQPKFRTMK